MPKRRRPPPANHPDPAAPADAEAAYSAALKPAFKATATRVQQMHQAIAGKTFDTLGKLPGVAVPSNWVRGVHDVISDGVYAAVRGGGAAALSLAGAAEQLLSDPARAPAGPELALRSGLNALAGDALAAAGNSVALRMDWFVGQPPLAPLAPPDAAGLAPRVCVFIHGLACNEQSWFSGDAWPAESLPTGRAPSYGAFLAQDLGLSAVYLRYNTGLAIAHNGRQLAEQLDAWARAAPQVRDWVLVGHSMGGLVARSASDHAAAAGLAWAQRCSMLICIGTPHQGAPLEQLGHLVSGALELSNVTQPLAHIANARSQGVKDLRHGRRARKGAAPAPTATPALCFIAGSLGDADGKPFSRALDRVLGDGLVTQGSAVDTDLAGDVQRVSLPGLGHMALLNHPRVYAVIRGLLEQQPA